MKPKTGAGIGVVFAAALGVLPPAAAGGSSTAATNDPAAKKSSNGNSQPNRTAQVSPALTLDVAAVDRERVLQGRPGGAGAGAGAAHHHDVSRLMKPFRLTFLLWLVFSLIVRAQEARFFRVAGPESVTITSLTADGYVTWTNTPTNAVFTVQTTTSQPGGNNWVDYVCVPGSNAVTSLRLHDPNPPDGMALIAAGQFTMGNAFSGEGDPDEVPTNTVYVSAFYMDKYEVTKALWDEVYQWATNRGYNFSYVGSGLAASHPVQTVTWTDCVKWCNARSEKELKTPAYYTNTSFAPAAVYRTGQVDVQNNWVNWNAGYRLPTEAEWEKAARGGLSGKRFPWGDAISHSRANYTASTYYPYDLSYPAGIHPAFGGNTSTAGYFAPNGYGLHDLAGNVWERCWDRHGVYPGGAQTDPRGPATGTKRSRRGGSCGAVSQGCRVTYRNSDDPFTHVQSRTGFRSAISAGQ